MHKLIKESLGLGVQVTDEERDFFFNGRAVAHKPRSYLGMRAARVIDNAHADTKSPSFGTPMKFSLHKEAATDLRIDISTVTAEAASVLPRAENTNNVTETNETSSSKNLEPSFVNTAIQHTDTDKDQQNQPNSCSKNLSQLASNENAKSEEKIKLPASAMLEKFEDLRLMKREIESVSVREGAAFIAALNKHQDYVLDATLWTRFLDSQIDKNHAQAARRLIRSFETKRSLFGEARLARTITQDDLDYETAFHLNMGCSYFHFEEKDDRIIWVWRMNETHMRTSINSRLCRIFYEVMIILTDSKKPVSLVIWSVQSRKVRNAPLTPMDADMLKNISGLFWSLPIILESIHLCYNTVPWHRVVKTISEHSGNSVTVHGHYGDTTQCTKELFQKYKLPSFVLVGDSMLTDSGPGSFGQITCPVTQKYLQLLQLRRVDERLRYGIGDRVIAFPSKHDVLASPSDTQYDIHHPGNVSWMRLVCFYCKSYTRAKTEEEKLAIRRHIIKATHDTSGSFLEIGAMGWVQDRKVDCRVSKMFDHVATLDKTLNSFPFPVDLPNTNISPANDRDVFLCENMDPLHPGNSRFLSLMESVQDEVRAAYPDTKKIEKISDMIVLKINSSMSRFLIVEGGKWVPDRMVKTRVGRILLSRFCEHKDKILAADVHEDGEQKKTREMPSSEVISSQVQKKQKICESTSHTSPGDTHRASVARVSPSPIGTNG